MKSLKFAAELVPLILAGEKTSTWRLYDDKDLQTDDTFACINKDTGAVFGTAVITNCWVKPLGSLEAADWEGHEPFSSEEDMYATYRSFYGEQVDSNTEVKIIQFAFQPT